MIGAHGYAAGAIDINNCKQVEKTMKFEVDTELFPFENRFITTDNGAEIHYVDEGEGPVILMLHGNPTY